MWFYLLFKESHSFVLIRRDLPKVSLHGILAKRVAKCTKKGK